MWFALTIILFMTSLLWTVVLISRRRSFIGLIYYCKHAYYLISCSLVSLLLLPAFLMRPRDVRNTGFGFPILNRFLQPLGIRWKISGKDRLLNDSACIIVCNHQSGLDFILPLELAPDVTPALVAKRSILYLFPFGPAAWLCGGIFINRGKGQQCRTAISTTAKELHKKKIKMWMFPEGTRSKRDELLPFKKGAFQVAVQNKLPVVPIVISPYAFIDDKKKVFGSGEMLVTVLPPIQTSSQDDVSLLTEKCRNIMNEEFKRLGCLVQTNSYALQS